MLAAALGAAALSAAPGAAADTFTVTSRADAGPGSLRAAIYAANGEGPPERVDTIRFLPPARGGTVELTSALPTIRQPVLIEGCDPAVAATRPCAGVRGPAGSGADGLRINAGPAEVAGLAITRMGRGLVHLAGAGGLLVRNSWFGVDMRADVEANGLGMALEGLGGTVGVGDGASSQEGRNVIAASRGPGIEISGSFYAVRGNRIGLTASGLAAPNGPDAIRIEGPLPSENTIGGDGLAEQNLIAGHSGAAVRIRGASATGNLVLANRGANPGAGFIDLDPLPGPGVLSGGPNGGIPAPEVTSATSEGASGTALPRATVRLFRRSVADPGTLDVFLGRYSVDGDGVWVAPYRPQPPGQWLVATQTAAGYGTSELSQGLAYRDVTAPETRIISGPQGRSSESTALFSFEASEPGASFSCAVDYGPWAPCSSPHRVGPFRATWHVFHVRAADELGNADPTPAERRFGLAGPEASAGHGPRLAGLRVALWATRRHAAVRFWLSERGGLTLSLGKRVRRGWRRIALARRAVVQGPNSVRLSRRLTARLRRPGRFRARARVMDLAGRTGTARVSWRTGRRARVIQILSSAFPPAHAAFTSTRGGRQ